jgi:hypothetical protein
VVRWREHGRNRSRLFALKRDAEAFDRDVERRRQLGPLAVQQLTARGGPTLDEWIEHRWAVEHATTLEQSTRDRYANVYKVDVWQFVRASDRFVVSPQTGGFGNRSVVGAWGRDSCLLQRTLRV